MGRRLQRPAHPVPDQEGAVAGRPDGRAARGKDLGPYALRLRREYGPLMVRPVRTQPPDGGVQSVYTAVDVLECLMRDEEVGVSDVARRLGVAKSTAHRLLTTWCARDMAERNPDTGRYRLGMRLFEFGQMASDRFPLRRAALPLLEELRQASGHTVHLISAGPPGLC